VIDVSIVDARGRPVRVPALARWLERVAPASAAGEVTVALVSDARMRALNRQFRRKDYATDVLSFPGARGAPPPRARARRSTSLTATLSSSKGRRGRGAPLPSGASSFDKLRTTLSNVEGSRGPQALAPELGDIVIARGVAARQARLYGHSLAAEFRVLALHGLLHLLGYDHDTDTGQMAKLERRLRRKGGLTHSLSERA
jgi:probable rRNA maturation factor